MANVINNFQSLANDSPNVMISAEMYQLAERKMATGQFAVERTLDNYMSKTMRIIRYRRFDLPTLQLAEGIPPDSIGMFFDSVDVTLEQWGIVAMLTDVSQLTITHPILQIAMERCSLAISELTERENCKVLLTGTQVVYGGTANARTGLDGTGTPKTYRLTTSTILSCTTQLRSLGAPTFEGDLYGGVMTPQQEGDVNGQDTTFQNASNFARVRKLENAEIGIWMGVHWVRGNFLPIFVGVAAADGSAATATKAKAVASDTGGSLATGNYKVVIVAREGTSDYERKISQASGNLTVSASITTGSILIDTPTSTNYVYDVYMTTAGGSTYYKVASRLAGNTTSNRITTAPVGTETTAPTAPQSGVEVFVGWVIGKDAFARVKLNKMSMQAYITPDGASWENPLAQGRKVGCKMMYKCAIQDNNFMVRFETVSTYASNLPA